MPIKAIQIIKECRNLGVVLSIVDGQIKVQGAKSKLTQALLAEIKQHKPEIIEALNAAQLHSEQSHSRFTLSDFPLAKLSQEQLQDTESNYQDIQDIYLSTPMQRGMLFHGMLDGADNAYVNVTHCDLEGDLNVKAFKDAWQYAVAKHDIFRTCFIGFDFEVIHQLVQQQCKINFTELDWRGEADTASKLEQLYQQETKTGFDFAKAPLMRWTLVRLSETRYHFIWANHHALLDGWCSSLVFSEVLGQYIEKSGIPLTSTFPPAISYKNYIKWLSAQSQDAARDYWRSVVEHLDEKTELPVSLNDRTGESELHIALGAAGTTKLSDLAKACQCTVNVLVQSAWAAVLHYFTGDEKVVFGATISGRPATLPNVESIVGLFLNSVPVSARINSAMSFAELFSHLQKMNTDSQEYGYYALSEIQQLSGVAPGSKLFDSLVVFENYPIDQAVANNSAALPLQIENPGSFGETNFPLTIVVSQGECVDIKLRYKQGVFSDTQIAMIGDCLLTALFRIANAQSDQLIGSLNLADIACHGDKAKALTELKHYPAEKCLHQIFEQQVETFPQRIAVSCGERELSYTELNQKANQIAHLLRSQGVGADTLVALCVDRSIDMLVAILAVLKAGGAYVPIDPRYPSSHLKYVLDDAQASIVLTQDAYLDIVNESLGNVISLDDLSRYAELPEHNLGSIAKPDNLAYIIYTSGSTGKPKGVMIEHHNVVRLMQSAQQHFEFSEHDVWTLFHSYAFDFSVWELWGALFYGGKVVVVDYEDSRSPERLINIINDQKVTVLNQTPSAFYQLLANLSDNFPLPGLRYVVFGGEALETQKLTSWFARPDKQNTQLINMYGITETTVHVTFFEVNAANRIKKSIGQPLDDLGVIVANKNQQVLPAEVTGEMLVTGAGLARGYLNCPELNAERFIELEIQGQTVRCYRSGDLCHKDANGNLFYQGRIDHQVKIRGFRIELGEIQHHLLQHAEIESTVVIADQMPSGDKRLVAYLQRKEQMPASAAELTGEMRDYLGQHLPVHMIPSLFIEVTEFKLTNNGKVNTRILPLPSESNSSLEGYLAPATELETELCAIWQRVLQVEKVGTQDNFFSLGGDSILAIRITALAKQADIDLTLSELFEQQTIQNLAALAKFSQQAATSEVEVAPFALLTEEEKSLCADCVDAYPLSTLQEGMVFHTVMEKTMYHDITSHHIQWHWDEALFAQSVDHMIAHHPILRSSYDLSGERPLQRVEDTIDTPLTVVDIRHHSADEQEHFVQQWIDEEKRTGFIWNQAPLFRLFVHLRGENSCQFTLSFHHSILDGWSVVSLKTELYDIYRKLLSRESLPPLSIDWAQRDFVAQELAAMADNQARDYWMSAIADSPTNQIPELSPASESKLAEENVVMVEEIGQYGKQAIEIARKLGVPLQHLLLAVHFKVLSFVSGNETALSCVTNNGRPEKQGGDSGFGLFLNLLPVAISVKDNTWSSLITSIKETMVSNARYRHFPLSIIQRESQRDFSEVTFNYTHFHGYQEVADDSEMSVVDSTNFAQANFDFKVMFQRDHESDKLNLAIRYNRDKYAHAHIENIAGYYLQALKALVTDPAGSHSKVSFLAPATMATLAEWGTGNPDQAFTGTTLVGEFEKHCRNTPDAIAVTLGKQNFCYEQLNCRANRLASYLLEQDIGGGDYIGVFTLRNLELFVAILAIQKIGAAYVLIEPGNTEQRIKYIVQDAKIELVLTQSDLIERLPLRGIDVLPLEGCVFDSDWLEEYSADNPDCSSQAGYSEQTAYVIYTSGTTGGPKGVEISFHSLMDYLSFAAKSYFNSCLSGAFVCSSHGFDLAIPGLLLPLMSGKTVQLAPWGEEIQSLQKALNSDSDSLLVRLTPLHTQALLDLIDTPIEREHTFVIGGDTLTLERLNAIRQLFPKANIYNHYGPSETVIGSTLFDTKQLTGAENYLTVPIGQPMDNTHVRVLNNLFQPVPVGTPGELFIGGDCVAKGYLNSPELTSQRFVTLADNQGTMRRFYCSGDKVRWLTNGELQFINRIDWQVKIRGYRVELAEIEFAIRQSQLATDFAVVAFEHEGEQRIAAYLVLSEKCSSLATLEQACAGVLPGYMLPHAFIELEQLPTTANGKLNKAALPSPTSGKAKSDTYVAPSTEIQEKMCAIWQQLLNVELVGIKDDFFVLGGHSLLATKLINLIKRETGRVIPLRALFENPTVELLCELEDDIDTTDIGKIVPVSENFSDDELTEEGEL